MTTPTRRAALTLAAVALVTAACSGDGEADVDVSLEDGSISMSTTDLAAGELTFSSTNEGTSIHEIEVFSVPEGTETGEIPVEDNVADVEGAGLELIDEVEDIAPSTTADLTVDLEPGSYALICNLAGHYAAGMHVGFTVA